MRFFIVSCLLLGAVFSRADERFLSKEEFARMGFKLVAKSNKSYLNNISFKIPFGAHTLPWPVTFADSRHTVAQNYVNFQQYGLGSPYYHGGCDLRAKDHGSIVSPVSGRLEAGYYGYSDNADGSTDKHWNAWNGSTHDDPYFEVAVVTDDNYRFEFHHVNSLNLPQALVDKLNAGNSRVEKGELLGYVNGGPFPDYEHTHYNIIDPNGVRLNPEYFSQELPDQTPPAIHAVFAVWKNGTLAKIENGQQIYKNNLEKIVVATTDSHDNDAYVQTPMYAAIHFSKSNSGYAWDFRQTLLGPDMKWPDIRSFFTSSLSADGIDYETRGQYGEGMFLINLPVSASDAGDFQVQIGDSNNNFSSFNASVK